MDDAMDEAMVSQVRRFNRVVTQRVGALDDRYLARDRPLGEARVLWEIGDDGSDDLARSFLEPLSEAQCARLVAAMADVERLLTAGLVEIDAVDPARPAAQHCLREYFAELDRRFDGGFDPALSIPADLAELRPSAGLFVVASLGSEPIRCGAPKFHGDEPTQLKRMWVARAA